MNPPTSSFEEVLATEDPQLLVYREVADALRQAYQSNKEAERYHLRGALRAATHHSEVARRLVQQAHVQLQSLSRAPVPAACAVLD